MKKKILALSILVVVFSFAFNVYAVKQVGNDVQVQQQAQTANQGEDTQVQIQSNEQIQISNGSENQVQSQNQEQNISPAARQNQEKNQEQQGQVNAEQHRSTVANFVQKLLQVSEREKGIGAQVKTIAQQQNQSAETTIQATEKIQTRSKIKTFFFGTDYKNLGTLRSEIVQTKNRLEQLNKLIESVQNEADKTELQNQIQTLTQEQTKIENFIKEQEGKFSMFGWLVKLFN